MSTLYQPYADQSAGGPFGLSDLPEWASAHIPPDELTAPVPARRARPALPFSRTARASRDTSIETTSPTQIDDPEPDRRLSTGTRVSKRAVLTLAGGVLIAVTSVLAGVALVSSDGGQASTVAGPVPGEQGSVMPVADFCTDNSVGSTITTSGPGSDSSAAGVIAAFDYAYYTERDGQRVADLMVNPPNTVPVIQAAIDAVTKGTRACVTSRPTSDPLVFLVDVTLRAPAGSDGALRQRITVAQAGSKFKIARVEDR